jgi:O-antigen/teichoic acid export membrane protein
MGSAAARWRGTLTSSRLQQLWYVPVLGASMALMMIRLLVMARLLSVRSFGQVSFGLLISAAFGMLGCLGLQSLLQRELPVRLYRGQQRRGLLLAAQCNVVAVGLLVIGTLAFVPLRSMAGAGSAIFIVGMLHGYSQQVFLIVTVESRSRGEIVRFAQQNFYRSLIVLLGGALVAFRFGSAFLVLATESLTTLAIAIYISVSLHRRAKERWSFVHRLAFRTVGRIRWNAALTLMGVLVVGYVLLSLDRWVAAKLLNINEFAQYAFAWILLSMAQSAQTVVNSSAYPWMARHYAAMGWRSAYRVCVLLSGAGLASCLVLSVPAWLILRFGVHRWFPLYDDTILLFPLFLLVAMLRVSDFWTSYLLIIGREARVLALNLASGVFSAIIWLLIVRPWRHLNVSILSVAYLAAIMTISSYCAVMIYACRFRRLQ